MLSCSFLPFNWHFISLHLPLYTPSQHPMWVRLIGAHLIASSKSLIRNSCFHCNLLSVLDGNHEPIQLVTRDTHQNDVWLSWNHEPSESFAVEPILKCFRCRHFLHMLEWSNVVVPCRMKMKQNTYEQSLHTVDVLENSVYLVVQQNCISWLFYAKYRPSKCCMLFHLRFYHPALTDNFSEIKTVNRCRFNNANTVINV